MGTNLNKKGNIFNIQKYSIHDGPGVRTIVFFKGCPLRCLWCSNPESLETGYEVMLLEENCINCGACVDVCPENIHSIERDSMGQMKHMVDRNKRCIGCKKCEEICPSEAVRIAGEEMTLDEVMDIVKQDIPFYRSSGGGVTLGGGELTFQPEFAKAILKESKKSGIHTAVETCGYTNWDVMMDLKDHIDLFLFDIKHIDSKEHERLTGRPNEKILKNLIGLLESGSKVKIRMPMITGFNDSREVLDKTMKFIKIITKDKDNFEGVDILPYHKLGMKKYEQLEKEYPIDRDIGYSTEDLKDLKEYLDTIDLPINLVKH